MNNKFDTVIFGNKTFSKLLKDRYDNSNRTENQIAELIAEIRPFITNTQQAVMLVPLIIQYMDVKVKNNEHLVKMAGVVQRAMAEKNGDSSELLLSDAELQALTDSLNDLSESQKLLTEKIPDKQ